MLKNKENVTAILSLLFNVYEASNDVKQQYETCFYDTVKQQLHNSTTSQFMLCLSLIKFRQLTLMHNKSYVKTLT